MRRFLKVMKMLLRVVLDVAMEGRETGVCVDLDVDEIDAE